MKVYNKYIIKVQVKEIIEQVFVKPEEEKKLDQKKIWVSVCAQNMRTCGLTKSHLFIVNKKLNKVFSG